MSDKRWIFESTPRQSGKSWAYERLRAAAAKGVRLDKPSAERMLSELQRYRWRPVVVMGCDFGRDPVQQELDRLDAAEREANKGKPL